jgi:hypothetical protein
MGGRRRRTHTFMQLVTSPPAALQASWPLRRPPATTAPPICPPEALPHLFQGCASIKYGLAPQQRLLVNLKPVPPVALRGVVGRSLRRRTGREGTAGEEGAGAGALVRRRECWLTGTGSSAG